MTEKRKDRYKELVCKNCENHYDGWISYRSKNNFCSKNCVTDFYRKKYIEKWLSGKVNGTRNLEKDVLSLHVRNYLLEEYKYKCAICGWGEMNKYTGKIPLEIDHIDGNSRNNKRENLRVLCPNCHSLTSTYKSLNNGNGRVRKVRK